MIFCSHQRFPSAVPAISRPSAVPISGSHKRFLQSISGSRIGYPEPPFATISAILAPGIRIDLSIAHRSTDKGTADLQSVCNGTADPISGSCSQSAVPISGSRESSMIFCSHQRFPSAVPISGSCSQSAVPGLDILNPGLGVRTFLSRTADADFLDRLLKGCRCTSK